MRKTHKKVLGFAGLGLVAAVTAVAAVLPSPTATAVSSFTDRIQVRIENAEPQLELVTGEPSITTDPNYGFSAIYDNISDITATLENKDWDGTTLVNTTIWSEHLDWVAGQKDFALNLNDYGGYGDFTITVVGLGEGGVPIERILTFKYREDVEEVNADDDGNAEVDVDVPEERVAKLIINVYDETGTKVKTIEIDNPTDPQQIDLGDLADGQYDLEINSINKDGDVIDTVNRPAIVDKDGTNASVDVKISDVGESIGRVVIEVKDSNGNVIHQITVNNPNPGDIENVTLPDNLPKGDYTVSTVYYNPSGSEIKSTEEIITKSDLAGIVEFGIKTKVDTLKTIETVIYDEGGNVVRTVVADRDTGVANVYDKDGNLIFAIPDGFKGTDEVIIPMSGLDAGTYTAVITFRNMYGNQIGNTKTVRIKWDGEKPIIVPDTGNFFEGLNISREDYLITGLAVFMVIGVVAFGIVAKNRRNKAGRKHRR